MDFLNLVIKSISPAQSRFFLIAGLFTVIIWITPLIDKLHENGRITEYPYHLLRAALAIVVGFLMYGSLSSVHEVFIPTPDDLILKSIQFIGFAIISLLYLNLAFHFLIELVRVTTSRIDRKKLPFLIRKALISLAAVYIGASGINYILYIVFPQQFSISGELTIPEIAIEFLYYTFMLMVTYGGADAITAVGAIARLLQAVEIIVFYIFIGILLNSFIGRASEPDSEATSHSKPLRRRRKARHYVKR